MCTFSPSSVLPRFNRFAISLRCLRSFSSSYPLQANRKKIPAWHKKSSWNSWLDDQEQQRFGLKSAVDKKREPVNSTTTLEGYAATSSSGHPERLQEDTPAEIEPSQLIQIENIPFTATGDILRKLFGSFGKVRAVFIEWHDAIVGHAHILFSNLTEAESAIESHQKQPLKLGKTVLTVHYSPLKNLARNPCHTLDIKGLDRYATEDEVRALFHKSEDVLAVRIDPLRRGKAQVDFRSTSAAIAGLERFMSKTTVVEYRRPEMYFMEKDQSSSTPKEPTRLLYITGYGPDAELADMREVLSRFGNVQKIRFVKDRNGMKGYSLVTFETSDCARNVMKGCEDDPLYIGDRILKLEYSYAAVRDS